ncbi:MAG: ATP-dependent zinc metalloprotease FtsH [Candidatus Pacebacteria bacterium]|nr:ATP-dependent zinc metalloprotease FtsH [Candidatus Paceibacterota bacterium]
MLFNQNKSPKKGKKKNNQAPSVSTQIISALMLFVLVGFLVDSFFPSQEDNQITISETAQLVSEGRVDEIIVKGEQLEITLLPETEGAEPELRESKKEAGTALSDTLVNYGVTPEQLQAIAIEINEPSGFAYWLAQLGPFLLPLLGLIFIIWFFMRQVKGSNGQAMSFGNSKARIILPSNKDKRVTFKDVAGNKEAKKELEEMVEFLKNPKKFISMGAKIPKGVLMTGRPGTGKTMLARAVAGEAKVPFFYLSGSDFVEMFVGVGASRVRDLFKMAKKMSPAIIFIDEIDAVGRSRGVGIGGGNDEREQTLNQILVEMDGFEPNEKLIVMAATNRSDVLDPALLRPGRFDRRVTLELPDRPDRKKILEIHGAKKPLGDDVNLTTISERTAGFSGADLESLMNEGAIIAALHNRKTILQEDLLEALEKVMIGPKRQSHLASEHERKVTAYHEAGHAIVASVLPDADPVHKVTIIPRGRAGGFTMKLPLDERRLPTKAVYEDDIAMGLGGYVAEEKIFGDITTGPSNDLKVASATARDMVMKFGMSSAIGPIVVDGKPAQTMFGGRVEGNNRSEKMLETIDEEVSKIIHRGLERARKVITEYNDAFVEIAETLLEVETLEQDSYNEILKKHGIAIKELPKTKKAA